MTIRRCSGFTLIEVLFSVVISALLALSLYLVLSQGIRIEKYLLRWSSGGRGVSETVLELSEDLRHMVSYTTAASGAAYLEAGPNQITFVSDRHGTLEEVHYALVEPDMTEIYRVEVRRDATTVKEAVRAGESPATMPQPYQLIRWVRPFLSGRDDRDEGEAEVLNDRIAPDGLKFFYLYQDDAGQDIREDHWTRKDLPQAVRFDLTVLEDQGRQETRLVQDILIGTAGGLEDGL